MLKVRQLLYFIQNAEIQTILNFKSSSIFRFDGTPCIFFSTSPPQKKSASSVEEN